MSSLTHVILFLGLSGYVCGSLPYDRRSLKFDPPSDLTIVNVTFEIHQLQNVNDRNQEVSLDLGLSLTWTDPELIEFPRNGVSVDNFLSVDPDEFWSKVWRPDIYFYNQKSVRLVSNLTPAQTVKANWKRGIIKWWFFAQVTLNCNMNFAAYPLDEQICPFLMGSTSADIDSVVFQSNFSENVMLTRRLGRKKLLYSIHLCNINEPDGRYYSAISESTFSRTGFHILLHRKITPFIINWFSPTFILVPISWISFVIPVDMIPGRMAVLVTIFLMLVNFSNSARNQGPESQGLTALDVWLIGCMAFIAGALFEYAALLRHVFKVRSDQAKAKHPKESLSRECSRIDEKALLIFASLFFIFIVVYGIVYFLHVPSTGCDLLH